MPRKKHILAFLIGTLACAALTGFAWCLLPKPPLLDGLGFSVAVYDSNHRLLRLTLSPDDKYRLGLALDQIAPELKEAVLLKEDRHFYAHPGVNPFSLMRAAFNAVTGGSSRSGGSTITMQLVRLRFSLKTRSLGGKLRQILTALELERHYTKDEILTAYLNLAPYGRNVEGVGAASLVYFGKNASALTFAESLALAVIPQSPAARAPNKEIGAIRQTAMAARRRLFADWLKSHPQDLGKSLLMDMPLKALAPEDLPFEAPHLVNRALKGASKDSFLVTTLDLDLQKALERHVRNYIEHGRDRGLKNAAALLLDWRTMELKALVGSEDFFDATIQGQVDGTHAKRSPGSALKPFVYALAMDQGLIHPLSLLKDSPASFGGYDPENFDREFLGPVSVQDALIKSRNIPAVTVAARLTAPTMYGFLKAAGITGLKDEAFYGLTTALGGAEVSMEELVGLYAMLANGGVWRAPRFRAAAETPPGLKLISPEASFMVLNILKDMPPPEPFGDFPKTRDAFPVAWKTGTSFSFRDAWTVGIAGPYVLAVWVGNFDGKGDPALVGRKAAAPLFFTIMTDLKPASPPESLLADALPQDLNLRRVEVCQISGRMPGPHCTHKIATWFIPGISPIKTCDIHREVPVDPVTGLRACTNDARGSLREVFEFWPSDLLSLFKIAGLPRREPPPYSPECALADKSDRGKPPEIVSPQNDVTYYTRIKTLKPDPIAFKAISDGDVGTVSWFVGDDFVGRVPRGKAFLWNPRPGRFIVRAVDDNGRSTTRALRVGQLR